MHCTKRKSSVHRDYSFLNSRGFSSDEEVTNISNMDNGDPGIDPTDVVVVDAKEVRFQNPSGATWRS